MARVRLPRCLRVKVGNLSDKVRAGVRLGVTDLLHPSDQPKLRLRIGIGEWA